MSGVSKKNGNLADNIKAPVIGRIAVIGMAGRFPGADDIHAFWNNLSGGINSIQEIPESRWDTSVYYSQDAEQPNKSISKWCGLVNDIDRFDNHFFDISPREANSMDPQQRLLLEETLHCVEDSGIPLSILRNKRTSVFIGAMAADYLQEAANLHGTIENYAGTGNYECILANRISHYFGFNGKSYSVDAACASSLVALHEAKTSLLSGESDFAIVGGVSLNFYPWKYITWSKSRMLSPDGQCKTFDKDADGYVPGDGVGVILLQRQEAAAASQNKIYALISGSAINHCGKALSLTTPSVEAQKDVILRAYKDAGVSPGTVTYVEAHGTGTSLGDPIEIEALTQAFKEYTSERQYCKIASVKSNIGHLEAAAGIAGVIKVLLMIKHRKIPKSLNINVLNPIINWADSPFQVAVEHTHWEPKNAGLPLRAGISSFGIGGINSHVVLESCDMIKSTGLENKDESCMFLLSAKSAHSLEYMAVRWKEFVNESGFAENQLPDICRTLANVSGNYPYRLGKILKDKKELAEFLDGIFSKSFKHEKDQIDLLIGNIEWKGFADLEELYWNVELFRDKTDEVLASLEVSSYFSKELYFNKIWDSSLQATGIFIAAYCFVNTLFAMGFRPRLVLGEKMGFLVAMVLCGVLAAEDALNIINRQKNIAEIQFRRPTIPFFDHLNCKTVMPLEFTKTYLDALLMDMDIDKEELGKYIDKARLLYKTQFSFKKYLKEWDEVLADKGMTSRQLLFDDGVLRQKSATEERLLLLLVVLSSFKRLNRKWNLTEDKLLKEKRVNELVDLVVDEVLDKSAAVHLILKDKVDYTSIIKGMNTKQLKINHHAAYHLIKEHNRILPNAVLWFEKAMENELAAYRTGSKLLQFGRTVNLEGTKMILPGLIPARELISQALFYLWQEGIDLSWEKLFSVDSYQKADIPGYVFEKKSFWLPSPHHVTEQPNQPVRSSRENKKTLTIDDPIIGDHVIGDEHIIPGAYMIEQGYRSAEELLGYPVKRIENIVIRRLGIVHGHIDIKTDIDVETGQFIFYSGNEKLCSGKCLTGKSVYSYKGLPELDKDFALEDVSGLYSDTFNQAGYRYGRSLQLIKAGYRNDDCCILKVSQPSGQVKGFNAFMLDGVFQSSLLAAYLKGIINQWHQLYMPYIIREMTLTGDFTNMVYVVIHTNEICKVENQLDIQLEVYDAAGTGVMYMRGLFMGMARKEVKEELNTFKDSILLSSQVWKDQTLPREDHAETGELAVVLTGHPGTLDFMKPFYQIYKRVIIVNNETEDYLSFFKRLTAKREARTLSVYYLWLYENSSYLDIEADDCFCSCEQYLEPFFYFIKALSMESYSFEGKVRVVVPAVDSFNIVGSDRGEGVFNTAVCGFIKSVMKENPQLEVIFVDFGRHQADMIIKIIDENLFNSTDHTVAYRSNKRLVQRIEPISLSAMERTPLLRDNGVYLITGGLGGVGSTIIEMLAKERRYDLIAVGRAPLDAEKQARLDYLNSNGGRVSYYQKDVTKKEDVEKLINIVKKEHRVLNGVMHLGGVLEDKLLIRKDWLSFKKTLIPKVKGILLLNHFTRHEKLDFFVGFSSIVSVFGNVGQADYAAANSFLDNFMYYRTKAGYSGKSISINWPLWAEVGMGRNKSAIKNFLSQKIFPVTSQEGMDTYKQILSYPQLPEQIIVQKQMKADVMEKEDQVLAEINGKKERYEKSMEDYIISTVSSYLGMNPQEMSREESFFSLGLDSIVLEEIMAEFEEKFENLPPTLLFDNPNLKKLLDYFVDRASNGQIDVTSLEHKQSVPKPFGGAVEKHAGGYQIAIIGINGKLPKSPDIHTYWQNMIDGRDCIEEIPMERWDNSKYFSDKIREKGTTYGKWGGFIDDVDKFDSLFFNISPKEAEEMDPQQRLLLESVWQTMEDAGYGNKKSYEDKIIGHYTGVMWNEYSFIASQEGFMQNQYVGPGSLYWAIANRVSYFMGFKGPSMTIDTACSSSLTAIHLACQGILNGDCEMAVAGGINLSIHPAKYIYLSQSGFLSTDGRCRSFGADASGYVPGEGVCSILLKPLRQAVEDNDHIYGIIRGSAINHGGNSAGFTIPDSAAHTDLIMQALKRADVSAEDISYVECQGTGTSLGDPIEINGLANAFRHDTNRLQFCPIGSVKSNIGHLEAAGGIAGVIKVLLAIKYKKIPGSIHSEVKNPNIDFSKTPFYVVDKTMNWFLPDNKLRLAGISSFGAGGANAHLIVEEYRESDQTGDKSDEKESELIVLSAKNNERLKEYLKSIYAHLAREFADSPRLRDIAFTLHTGRKHFEDRVAIIAGSKEELLRKLESLIKGGADIEDVLKGNTKAVLNKSVNIEANQEDRVYVNGLLEDIRLQELASLWIEGVEFDWSLLYKDRGCKRVSLPAYPFKRVRYWIESKGECPVPYHQDITSQNAAAESVQNWLIQEVSSLLKVTADDIDVNDEIGEYGFDSMSYTDFADRINDKYLTDLTPAVFFEQSSIRNITAYLCSEYSEKISRFYETDQSKVTSINEIRAEKIKATETITKKTESCRQKTASNGQNHQDEEPIAIIGMGCRFPQSEGPDEYWNNLIAQMDMISEVPKERWDWQACYGDSNTETGKTYIKWGGFCKDIDYFDAKFFGISLREAELMDPQQRIFLETVWETIENAGYSSSELWGSDTGVFVGVATSDYLEVLSRNKEIVEAHTSTGMFHSVLANRVSYYYNFHGPSESIDTACSGSLVAVGRALEALRSGRCMMAIAGGVNALLTPTLFVSFNKAGMLSGEGRCRTFDEKANGYVRGEGCGAVLLKPMSKAIKDNDHIYGIIRGCSVNHGGRSNSLTAPNSNAQADLLISAYSQARISPDRIGYIETHGTGTSLGDPIEINSLKKAFEALHHASNSSDAGEKHCILGAVKTNIGHLEAAAGMAGLIKVLLCLKHKKIPPNLHFNKLNPYIKLEGSPFVIAEKCYDWVAQKDESGVEYPRIAGISSFGIGGVNAHVVIEEYPAERKQPYRKDPVYLFVFSAKKTTSLERYIESFLRWLDCEGDQYSIGDMAYTLLIRRNHFNVRWAFIVSDKEELTQKLSKILKKELLNEFLADNAEKKGSKVDELYFEFGSQIIEKLRSDEFYAEDDFKEKLLLLGDLFVKGYEADWGRLYQKEHYNHIPMPSYVFERKRYWAEKPEDSLYKYRIAVNPRILHPLIDSNESTLDRQRFGKSLVGREFYLKEHVIGKESVLPAAVYLEMAIAAGNLSNPVAKVRKIINTVWIHPVVLEDASKEVKIDLYPGPTGVDYKVVSVTENSKLLVHSQGSLIYASSGAAAGRPEVIDIEEIKRRCTDLKSSADCYRGFRLMHLNYGVSFQTIHELKSNEYEAISLLKLSVENQNEFSDYLLFPTLMDGALQTAAELIKNHSGNKTYLPFSIREVEIIGALKESCYAYARFSDHDDIVYANEVYKFDIDIVDEMGNLLIRMKEATLKHQESVLEPEKSSLMYYQNEWVLAELDTDQNKSGQLNDIIIFDVDEAIYTRLKEKTAGQVSRIFLVKPGTACRWTGDTIYEVKPGNEESFTELIRLFTENGITPSHMIHLWSKDNGRDISFQQEELQQSFYSLFWLTKALMKKRLHTKFQVIYVYPMGSDATNPVYGGISGFFKTLPLENADFSCKTLGLLSPDIQSLTEKVWVEINMQHSGSCDICYLRGRRHVKVTKKFNVAGDKAEIRKQGVYLITGGNGGLGLIFARFLLESHQAKIVLASRSNLSESRRQELESLDGEVWHVKSDISQKEEIAYLIESIHNRFGQLNGIIHCAGVINDSYIINKLPEELEKVISPKVYGLYLLDEALKDEKLDFFVLFSSIVSLLGNAGQADYAYANSYMDCYAHYRENLCKEGKRYGKTLSINWPLWNEGGMRVDEGSRQLLMKTMGVKPINRKAGLEAFEHGLALGVSQFLVAESYRDGLLQLIPKQEDNTAFQSSDHYELSADSIAAAFQKWLVGEISSVLKVEVSDINMEDDISDYGFDSILLTELANRINEAYNLDILPPVFFEYSSIRSFSEYVCRENPAALTGLSEQHAEPSEKVSGMNEAESPKSSDSCFTKFTYLNKYTENEDIAIIGMSAVMPQSEDITEFWRNLTEGKDLITEIPKDRWDWRNYYGDPSLESGKTDIKWGGFMREVDKFDASFFDISPREAEIMDPQHRIFLQTVWKTVEDAGYKMSGLWGSKTGVFVGVSTSEYADAMRENGIAIEAHTSTGICHSILSNRISYLFNFQGPSEPIDTACSSSLVAVHRAAEAIRNGSCDQAIAGGVNVLLSPSLYISFNKAGMLSRDGRCKTFDKRADGYVRGEGCGAVLLKPLSKAKVDGDHIYGIIKATAVNHQGRSNSLTAPNPNSQADLLVNAYMQAGIQPNRVGYIEVHGTGTSLGDPIEINGLKKAFTELYEKHGLKSVNQPYCALGAVKTNIGHLEAAAGIAGLIKVLLALRYQKIPVNATFQELNPYIKLEGSPFYIPQKLKEWKAFRDSSGYELPRVAGISSFGFGGVNAHIVIEEYHGVNNSRKESDAPQLITLSAKTEERLRLYAGQLLEFVETADSLPEKVTLQQIAYTLQVGREAMELRLALLVSSAEDLKKKLKQYWSGQVLAEGVVSGGTGEDKHSNGFMIDGEEGKEYIKSLIRNRRLLKLGQLWVSGIDIDWFLLYEEISVKTAALPSYPFEKQRHWFDAGIHNEKPKNNEAHKEDKYYFKNGLEGDNMEGISIEGVSMGENATGIIKKVKLKKPESAMNQIKEVESVITQNIFPAIKEKPKGKMDSGMPITILKHKLKTLLAETLHISESMVNEAKSFTELGLDSILTVDFIKKINNELGTGLKAVRVYDHPNINTLTQYLTSTADFNSIDSFHTVNTAEEDTDLVQKKNPLTECHPVFDRTSSDIAIIGISGRFPGADNVEEYWNNLKNGISSVTEVLPERWDVNEFYSPEPQGPNQTYCKWGGFLKDIDLFDPLFFNISPTEAELMDPQQRLFLEQAWQALEDAGYAEKLFENIKCGIFAGVMSNDYHELLARERSVMNQAQAMTGNANSILASRIAYLLNLKGPAVAVDTACSSSLVAIHLAGQCLINGDADMMLAGGVSLYLTENSFIKMSNSGMLSKEGRCKSFDNGAAGFVPGEGAGVVVLKLLNNAVRDHDHIYGIIKGCGINQDGKTNGITAPSTAAQKELELDVYRKFNINPESISYVETHGTGTKLGDPIEIQALTDAFRCFTNKKSFCGIGSVKTNIGHTSSAAGVASLIKVLLSFRHKQIPPSLNFDKENEHISFADTPFYVNTQLREWSSTVPRRAAVSAFGFSGTNVHMVLEEYVVPQVYYEGATSEYQIVPVSARNAGQLNKYAQNILKFLENSDSVSLADLAYTLQVGRAVMEKRLAIVASNIAEVKQKLMEFLQMDAKISFLGLYCDSMNNIHRNEEHDASGEVESAMKTRDMDKLATLWVSGSDVDWKLLYDAEQHIPRRISLPTYPFTKQRCWINSGLNVNSMSPSRLHPLIEKMNPQMSLAEGGAVFNMTLYDTNRMVSDHKVHGQPLFPGTGFLEMAAAAGHIVTEGLNCEISNITWLSPMWVTEEKKEIRIILKMQEQSLHFQIQSKGFLESKFVTHAQGELCPVESGAQPAKQHISIESVKKGCFNHLSQEAFYRQYAEIGITYGKYLQGVQEIYSSGGEVLGKINLSPEYEQEISQYILHPALVDSALQCIAALEHHAGQPRTYVPFSVESIRVIKNLPARGYSYVRLNNKEQKLYNVDIIDENGAICVMICNVAVRPLPDAAEKLFYIPQWVLKPFAEQQEAEPINKGSILIVYPPETMGLETALEQEFRHRGASVQLIKLGTKIQFEENQWEINAGNSDNFNKCIEKLADVSQIFFLGGINGSENEAFFDIRQMEILNESQEKGVVSLFRLIKALSRHGFDCRPVRLDVITNNTYAVLPGEDINPNGASLIGFTRSLAEEFHHWSVNCLDISLKENKDAQALAKSILNQPLSPKPVEAAIRNDKRYERVLENIKLPPAREIRETFKYKGVYLIAGGASGIGYELGRYLAQNYAARLVLIGRSGMNERLKNKLSQIESMGGEAIYIQADLTDLQGMQDAVKKVKRHFGHINGAVHSAIVLNDKTINNMNEDILLEVLAPKVKGSVILGYVLWQEKLDFMMFFSSAQSFLCQAGQSNYAAASTFIDAYACYLQQNQSYPVKIINWGYWGSVGVVADERYRIQLAASGIYSIEPKQGMEIIERVLAQDGNIQQVVAVKGDNSALQRLGITRESSLLPDSYNYDGFKLQRNQAAFDKLDEWCCYVLLSVFQQMGVFLKSGERYDKNTLQQQLRIITRYGRLLDVLLDILAQAGFLTLSTVLNGSVISTSAMLDTDDTIRKIRTLEVEKELLAEEFPHIVPHVNLVWTCLKEYQEMLTGRKNHMEVMFPKGSMSLVEGIYSGYPIADYFNLIVADIIKNYIEKRLKYDPKSVIHVLELGSGTGGTSRIVLEAIKGYQSNVSFTYSDISTGFVNYGREEYGAQYPFAMFKVLDIEKPLELQEIEIDCVDIIFAANVIHVTKRIADTLSQVKRLLKENGLFIVSEATTRHNFVDMTFGLTEGWWHYQDEENRLQNSPLLNTLLWKNIMEKSGIKHIKTLGIPAIEEEKSTQCVIVGENSGETRVNVLITHAARSQSELRDKVLDYVIQVFSEVLKVNKTLIDTNATFERYGVDSLVGLMLIRRFENDFGQLPTTLLFEHMTAKKLSDYFVSEHYARLNELLGTGKEKESFAGEQLNIDDNNFDDKKLFQAEGLKEDEIAIIGVSGIYPGADNLEEFWENLRNGVNSISEIPKDRWNWRDYPDTIHSKWGGFIKDVDKFDPLFFHITPEDAEGIDPQARLFMETAWNAFEDAGYTNREFDRIERQVGVFVGVMNSNYEFLSGEAYGRGHITGAHSSHWAIPNRVSYRFDFYGPSLAVDTACSSSLTALHLACESLKRGDCRIAVAGGVNLILHPMHYQRLSAMNMITEDNKCKSFGAGADGFVDGEGVGAVILKPLEQAIRDHDRIYAVIKGSAINAGGKTSGFTVPNPIAQSKVIESVLQRTGTNPRTITCLEAHGTGTNLGDPIEIAGLTKAYASHTDDSQYCSIGSLKSNIGHLESAAGIAGLTKVILQMKYKQLVPSLNAEVLNPMIEFGNTPFYVQRELSEWQQPVILADGEETRYPRRAAVSSFGAGGANAHCIVEEYIPLPGCDIYQRAETDEQSLELIVLSAQNEENLKAYAQNMLAYLQKLESSGENFVSLTDVAYTLQAGREPMKERLAFICENIHKLCKTLEQYCMGVNDRVQLYTGNSKSMEKTLKALIGGSEGAEILKYIINGGNLDKIAQLWVMGADIDWNQLYNNDLPIRIALPPRPFLKRRYWVDSNSGIKPAADGFSKPDKEIQLSRAEKKIVRMAADILNVDEKEINIEKELDLEYYDSMELVVRITKEFGNYLDPMTIINCKSIKALSVYLDSVGIAERKTSSRYNLVKEETSENRIIDKATVRAEIVAMVARILKTFESEIDIDTDISEYGLNSINVMLLYYKLNEAYGNQIEPMMIVNSRSIRVLADFLVDNKLICA